MSLHPQPPSGPLLFVCVLHPAGPSSVAAVPHLHILHTLSPCSFFFFGSSSDVQEKIIKADGPVRQAFPLSDPVCIPANSTPVIRSDRLPGSVTDCWLMTGRTAASGTHLTSPLGFWEGFLSTQTYLESPEGSLARGVFNLLGWFAGVSFFVQGF